MKDFAVEYIGDDIVAYSKLLFETFPKTLFDPAHLYSSQLLTEDNIKLQHGRGAVHGFRFQDIDLVLRHYRRGGMPAKLSKDKYIWSTLKKTRAMRELEMLSIMHKSELPVPQPAAMQICKNPLTYTADIVTVLIPNAKTLSSILASNSLERSDWQRIGEVIRKFHKHNCNHGDLNAHNVMLDDKKDVYLVDFDNSEFKSLSGKWQEHNLQRLKRSLVKLSQSEAEFNYTASNFDVLLQGYSL